MNSNRYDGEYDMNPRKLFEPGLISLAQYWEATTPEERDEHVIDNLDAGRLSAYDQAYHDYYDHREEYRGRWDPYEFDDATIERLPWLLDYY